MSAIADCRAPVEFGAADIRARLPHRPPFLLPGRVVIDEPGRRGRGEVRLDADAPQWDDLCTRDLVPALLVESAAQVCGLVLGAAQPAEAASGGRHLLLAIDRVEYAADEPGCAPYTVEVALAGSVGAMHRFDFSIHRDGGVLAHGALSVMQQE